MAVLVSPHAEASLAAGAVGCAVIKKLNDVLIAVEDGAFTSVFINGEQVKYIQRGSLKLDTNGGFPVLSFWR